MRNRKQITTSYEKKISFKKGGISIRKFVSNMKQRLLVEDIEEIDDFCFYTQN